MRVRPRKKNRPRNLKESPIYMKRPFVLVTLLASGFALSATQLMPAAAQTKPAATAAASAPAPAGPTKIAIIAFEAAVTQTNEGQRNFADLQKKFQPRENELKTRNDEIETLTKQLQTQGATLSESARASQAHTIDEKKKRLDRDAEDLRKEGGQAANEMYNGLASKVYDVLSTFAQQQGYGVILDRSGQQTPVLLVQPSNDITKQIVEAYNLKSGIPAPPKQAGSAPAAPKPAPKAPATQK
jgi:outer membrane protein